MIRFRWSGKSQEMLIDIVRVAPHPNFSPMAHYKRKKSRRVVRCTLCTPHRWLGNAKGSFGKQPRRSTSRRPEGAELAR